MRKKAQKDVEDANAVLQRFDDDVWWWVPGVAIFSFALHALVLLITSSHILLGYFFLFEFALINVYVGELLHHPMSYARNRNRPTRAGQHYKLGINLTSTASWQGLCCLSDGRGTFKRTQENPTKMKIHVISPGPRLTSMVDQALATLPLRRSLAWKFNKQSTNVHFAQLQGSAKWINWRSPHQSPQMLTPFFCSQKVAKMYLKSAILDKGLHVICQEWKLPLNLLFNFDMKARTPDCLPTESASSLRRQRWNLHIT